MKIYIKLPQQLSEGTRRPSAKVMCSMIKGYIEVNRSDLKVLNISGTSKGGEVISKNVIQEKLVQCADILQPRQHGNGSKQRLSFNDSRTLLWNKKIQMGAHCVCIVSTIVVNVMDLSIS